MGNNWREDFIQDGWSLRISKSPVFLAVFFTGTSQHFRVWMHIYSISICDISTPLLKMCATVPNVFKFSLHR